MSSIGSMCEYSAFFNCFCFSDYTSYVTWFCWVNVYFPEKYLRIRQILLPIVMKYGWNYMLCSGWSTYNWCKIVSKSELRNDDQMETIVNVWMDSNFNNLITRIQIFGCLWFAQYWKRRRLTGQEMFNSFMPQYTRPSLVQIMACRLVGAM